MYQKDSTDHFVPKNVEDIYNYAASELNIPPEKVKYVVNNFYKTLKTFLSDPVNYRKIVINNFIKFEINKNYLKRTLKIAKSEKTIIKIKKILE